MKKRFLNVVSLVLVLAMFVPVFSFGEGMNDVETSPYKDEILKLLEEGILSGYPDGTFKPEGSITRGEFTKMIAKALKLEEDKESAKNFKDVKGKWYEGYVGAVFKAGLMEGTSKTTFAPEKNVTREQMIVILIRGLKMEELAKEMSLELVFKDGDTVSPWAKDHIALANKIGLINGDGTISFNPKEYSDRQTVAKFTFELIYNNETYNKKVFDLYNSNEKEEKDDKKGNVNEPVKEDTEEAKKDDDKKPDYDSIVSKHKSELSSLQSKYEGELSSLLSQAKREYEANKDNPDFSVTEFYKKYEGLGRNLEGQADSEVESVLSVLGEELKSNGYDTSIVDDLRSQYEEAKEDKEDSILP